MITRIRFSNFRSHVNSELHLRPISLLIGSVAAGKSNVFRGLLLLQSTIRSSLDELFASGFVEFQSTRSWWSEETAPIGFEVDLVGRLGEDPVPVTYTLKIADSPAGLYVLEETLSTRPPDSTPEWIFQRKGMQARAMGEFGFVKPHDPTLLHSILYDFPGQSVEDSPGLRIAWSVGLTLMSFAYHHLSVPELKAAGTGQEIDRIGYYGRGLPDLIAGYKFQESKKRTYEKIMDDMRNLLPNLTSIIVTQAQTQQRGLAMAFAGQRGSTPAIDLSDGTMLTLGLLSLIHGPSHPFLLCIEEPETGLNPRRLRWLFDRFIDLAYPRGDEPPTQVIFSTHSPWLVDLFGDMQDSVLLVEQSDGRSRVTPLTTIRREKLHQAPSPDDSIGYSWATGVYEGL